MKNKFHFSVSDVLLTLVFVYGWATILAASWLALKNTIIPGFFFADAVLSGKYLHLRRNQPADRCGRPVSAVLSFPPIYEGRRGGKNENNRPDCAFRLFSGHRIRSPLPPAGRNEPAGRFLEQY